MAVSFSSSVNGNPYQQMQQIAARINQIFAEAADACPEAMLEALRPTKELADMYCPTDTGDMLASGYLEITDADGDNPTVEIGYGRGGEPYYTPIVHEDMNAKHKPPTRAKWLEVAMVEDLDNMLKRIADAIGEDMGLA